MKRLRKIIAWFWGEYYVFTGQLTRNQIRFVRALQDEEIKWGIK